MINKKIVLVTLGTLMFMAAAQLVPTLPGYFGSALAVTDGGGPIPPMHTGLSYAPSRSAVFVADGGAPVPPIPNGPTGLSYAPSRSAVFVADGGAPVPPIPNGPTGLSYSA